MQKLLDILTRAGARYPALKRRLKEAEALGRWEVAVGPIIAKHSRAIKVEDGVLWVEVDHPIWKSELHHRKQQILAILNGQTRRAAGTPAAPTPSGSAQEPPLKPPGASRGASPVKSAPPAKPETPLDDILFLDPRGTPPKPGTRVTGGAAFSKPGRPLR